ncbi:MAG: DNA cytosine methyltransferase [Microcoleus sp.]
MKPIGVDLFAGAGGLSLGFEQAGFDVLAAVEIDPIHCATHEYNFPNCKVLCKSVTEVTKEDILSAIEFKEIDVIFGGPPCQGFSLIGKRVIDDPRNSLVFHFLRIIFELRPKYFVMENVKGMAMGKHQKFISEIISKIEYSGYKIVQPYQVLNAAYYGVPQNRERLFLIGARQDLPLPEYPLFITKPAGLTQKNVKQYSQLPYSPTVWDALQDLPTVEDYPELKNQDWTIATFGKPSNYGKQLSGLLAIDEDYSDLRQYDRKLITSSLLTKHSLQSIERFENTKPGKTEPISRFYRLNPSGVCNTLRAGTASNHGGHTSPRPIHPIKPRCITVREAARLHSYPDWFRFHVTKWHGFRQIGNSVPPLLGKAVGQEIMKVINANQITKSSKKIELGDSAILSLTMAEAAAKYGVPADVIPQRSRKS